MTKYTYYDRQSGIDADIPENMRIGDDLMIVTGSTLKETMTSPRVVDVCTFMLLDKGEAKMLINMKEYSLKAPCLAVIMPDQIYQLLEKSDDMAFRAVMMSRRFTDDLFRYQGNVEELHRSVISNPILDISDDLPSFNTYYKILLSTINSPAGGFRLQTARHLTISMLYHYVRKLRRAAEASSKASSKAEIIYARFCEDVRSFYRTNRSLPFYAGRLGVSTNVLTKVVKSIYGKTAAEYIDDITLIECKALLRSTDMNVRQISRILNFVSPSVFGKFFKRMAGFSPSDYRRDE